MAGIKYKLITSKPMPVIKDDIKIPSEIYNKIQKLSYALTLSI